MHRHAPVPRHRHPPVVPLALLVAGLALSAPGAALAACGLAEPVALGDFNGDGHADLVIGSPPTDVGDTTGVVHVLYGTGSGPGESVLPQQVWYLGTPGVPGDPYDSGGMFGVALATGDFDCDGIDDLAVGEHDAITVLYGTVAGGLTTDDARRLEGPEGSGYGHALAAGGFGEQHGCGDDLAVGAPDASGGSLYVYFGSPGTGLLPASGVLLNQDSPGVPGASELDDEFAAALVTGNFDGDFYEDLAVGVPGEEIGGGSHAGHGAVNVFYGGGDGFVLPRTEIWHQDSAFVEGSAESYDRFGAALAAGDVDGDGREDLIAGVPGEDDENYPVVLSDLVLRSGAVNVIHGSPTGLDASFEKQGNAWTQDSGGIEGENDQDDFFGSGVASGDFDGDGYDDMAVGTPFEDREGLVVDGGVVNVLHGGADGLSSSGNRLVHQNTSGLWVDGAMQIDGYLQDDDLFGCRMVAGRVDGDDRDDLVVTVEDGAEIAVNVAFGSGSGLTADRNVHWICEGLAGCSAYRQAFNLPSAHAPVTDGIHTDPPGTGEWSDVRPLAFTIESGGPVATDPDGGAGADGVLFAALAPEPDPEIAHLHVLVDLVQRTDTAVAWNDPVATIRFPALYPGVPGPRTIGVHLVGAGPGMPAMPPAAWLDLDNDGDPDDTSGGSEPNVPASSLGIEATAGFAASPYGSTPHLQVEMKIPLSIPAGFPDPDGPLAEVPGGPGGAYTPAPGLWTVEFQGDAPGFTWRVGAAALVRIEPDGGLRASADPRVQGLVDVALLDDLGDGDQAVTFAVLSTPVIDATGLFQVEVTGATDPGRLARPTAYAVQDVDGNGLDDLLAEVPSADLLAAGVVTPHAADVVVTARNGPETVGGTVADLTLPRAGSVPDGGFQTPGSPLTIGKGAAGAVELSWNASCDATDVDYAIYEGTLGSFASHRPLVCTTGGATAASVTPGSGDRYYLIVPLDPDGAEGGAGATSTGSPRPPGLPADDPSGEATDCGPRFAETCGR